MTPIQKKESDTEKVLNNLETGSFLEKLTSFLNEARIFIEEEDEPNQWILATYYLFDQGSISTADCHPRLEWANCDEYSRDTHSVRLKNNKIFWVTDALNDQFSHINSVSIKQQLEDLSAQEKDLLLRTIIDPSYRLTKDLVEIYDTLKEASESIRKQYLSKIISTENGFSYKRDIRNKIHDLLKKIILEKKKDLDCDDFLEKLYSPQLSKEICKLVIEELFKSVSIDKEKASLDFGNDLILSFSREIDFELIPKEAFGQITGYHVNGLISKNYKEEPLVLDHAFQIALNQQNAKLEAEFQPGMPNDFAPEIENTFISWIQKNYYNSFCAKYAELTDKDLSDQEKIEIPPQIIPLNNTKKKTETIKNNNELFSNLDKYIDEIFIREYSWNLSGSCLLSCFLHPPGKEDLFGENILTPIREEIALLLEQNKKDYIEFVEVSDSLSANENQWVISQENSEKSKIEAISLRATEIANTRTYLTGIEINLLANILKNPIYIYRQDAESFEVDPTSNHITPHIIYGEQYKERPPYFLLLNSRHYTPLIPKNGKPLQDTHSITLSSGLTIPFRFPSSKTNPRKL